MIDSDAFEAQLAAAMRGYVGSARLEVDPPALARTIAVRYPRRRTLVPALDPWRAFAWLALAALLAAIALAAAALALRPPAPQRPLGLIAFERGRDIFVADIESDRVAKFAGEADDLYLGSWSPNGRWLSAGNERQVFLLDPATMTLRPVPLPTIRAADLSTPTLLPVGPTAAPAATAAGGVFGSGGASGYGAAGWMPTGESMLLHEYGTTAIFAVDINTGTTSFVADPCNPVLSPDGSHVAGIEQGRIVIVELATGNRTHIADFGGLGCGYWFGSDAPTWSADSERLAIVTTNSIRIVRRDGSQPADIVALDFPAGYGLDQRTSVRPLWSPNGEWIAFIGPAGLEVVRPDGSQRHQIAPGDIDQGHFAWTPDSTHLDYGIAVGEAHPDGLALSSVDVITGETQPIELAAPYVDAFARQPTRADTPRFVLP